MLRTAATGIPEGIRVMFPSPEPIPHVQRRPVVDIETLSAKAANEIITVLAEHQEQQRKANKTFLRRRPARPEIHLPGVVENLKQAVLEQYRISGAACVPPVLDLNESHMAEIAKLQEKAVEDFCRQVLRAVEGDNELERQIFEICPALRPLPEPDSKALAGLQKQADKTMAAAMSKHEDLIDTLRELDELVRQEAQALAGTNRAGNGRIRRQAEHVKAELIRLLGQQKICRQIKIPVARW